MGLFKTDEEKKKEHIGNALEFANKNEHDKAVKELEKALKLFPSDEEALFNLGFVYSDMGDTAKAYDAFKTLINKNPKHIEAFNSLGLIFAKQAKFNDAIFVYQKGIEHNPEAALLYNNMGNVYFDTGNYEKALACFKKAGDLDPVYSERLYQLGISSIASSSKDDELIKKLEESAKKNVNKAKAAHDLGAAYMEKKMYDKAIEAFNNSLSIDPNYLSSYVNLGHCYQQKDRLDMAIKAFEKALILNPKSAKTYNTIGLLYDKMDKPEIAVKAYRKAVALDPTYANSHYMLGQLYQNRGNTDKAVAEFTKHIRIHETGGMVEDAMHRIAEMKGMTFEQVKELFDQYIEKKPEPKPAAAPVMEKRDEKDYLKNLKEKMAAKKEPAMPTEQPPAKPATPVQPAGKAIDPQEYMRQLKAKMQQKKSGAIPDQPPPAVKITQTGYSIPKQPAIRQAQPVSTVREAGHTGNVPVQSAASDAGPRAEDSGLHEISLPPPPPAAPVYQPSSPPVISTQMAEPTIERIDDDIPVVDLDSPAPSSGNNHSGIAPSPNFMETIIKPVGTDAPLPTDKMPEFHEQPSPGRNIPPAQGTAHNQASAPKKDDEPPAGPKIKHNYW